MKLKIPSLLLSLTLAAIIFSCKDDDDKKLSNAYIFDGKKKAVKYAGFEDFTEEDGGGYRFRFSPTTVEEDGEDGPTERIEIDIPKEMMGAKFELTEEKLYDWGWWFDFFSENGAIEYQGFGEEGEMENVKSGKMSAIKKDDNKFTIEVDIIFTDGKTFELYYSGTMVDEDENEGPSRKSTHVIEKNVSPNN